MPNLKQIFNDQDIGFLQIVADLWRVEVALPDTRQGSRNLNEALLDPELLSEIVLALPQEARDALGELQQQGNRLRWSAFSRTYGEIREMGSAKRNREKPHLSPISASEQLYYRALLGRAYFDAGDGVEEFAYLPDDIAVLLPPLGAEQLPMLGRPATPAERKYTRPASDMILDHSTTLLAALRLRLPEDDLAALSSEWPIPYLCLQNLLLAAGLLDDACQPNVAAVRDFLEMPRADALARLARTWLQSSSFNDLLNVPNLSAEGAWQNHPLKTRQAVLGFVQQLDTSIWQHLPAWVADIKRHRPDFQRSGGEYDAWYLRDSPSGEYLRGVENWDAVEGALLNFIITGPMHWLGMVDLASRDKDTPAIAFRFSSWSAALLSGGVPENFPAEDEGIFINSRLEIDLPHRAGRSLRYQIARFCQWEGLRKRSGYRYRINPESLRQAHEQGLKVEHLLSLLQRHTANPLPANLIQALERWDQHGVQARVESVSILRFNHPDLLGQVQNSRAARFLGSPLGPTTVIVKRGAESNVLAVLAELGILAELVTGAEK